MTVQRRTALYAAALFACAVALATVPERYRPAAYSVPASKVDYYKRNRASLNCLFVGDSRTYTDIEPRVVGPAIGRSCYNLASFGLWMPLQYLEFRDVFPLVTPGTAVVWSLSHQNFAPIGDRWWISGQYKFTIADVFEYAWDGYPIARVVQEYEEWPFSPFEQASQLRQSVSDVFESTVWARATVPQEVAKRIAPPVDANATLAAELVARLRADRRVTIAHEVFADGRVTSIEAAWTDGGYDRYVLDQDFFRQQQSQLFPHSTGAPRSCTFHANPVYWRTFNKILNLAAENHIDLIVNYIEDAPGSWTSDSDRACARAFIHDEVEPVLAAHGVSFIAPDLYPLIGSNNDYYFDHSHLHVKGAAIYSTMLAQALQPLLGGAGRATSVH